jgi:hypothetical protein
MFALSIQTPLSSPYFHDVVWNCAQRVPTQDLLNESEVHFSYANRDAFAPLSFKKFDAAKT